MEIPPNELRNGIARLNDTELLKRWHSGQFTPDAQPLAELEIASRGLDPSMASLSQLTAHELGMAKAYKRRQWSKVGSGMLKLVLGLVAFALSVIGAQIVAAALR